MGNSMLTVILGYTENSVEMLAANAVMGNLGRLFLVFCFGLGAATAVLVGKAIGEGQSEGGYHVSEQGSAALYRRVRHGAGSHCPWRCCPHCFLPVVFPMFKLFGESATIAAALAVTSFASIPLHAYSISSITGVLRSGGDVLWSAALDLAPQWIVCLPLTALCALVLKPASGLLPWPCRRSLSPRCPVHLPGTQPKMDSRCNGQ